MNKAVFLDRDGIINIDSGYTYLIKDLELIPLVVEGLRKIPPDYKLIIITNQAGIGRGLYSEKDYFVFRNHLKNFLDQKGIIISKEYFCPHHPVEGIGKYKIDCNCRKPKIGMLEQAARDFDLELNKCWVVGDKNSDIQAGITAGCKTIHVLTGRDKNLISTADFTAKNLSEVADYISKNNF